MKKTTPPFKTTTPANKAATPAPAPKPAAPAPAPAKAAAPAPAKPAPKPAAAPAPTPAPVAAKPSPVPAPKPVAAAKKTASTTISAEIDVGFGNALYIRGEGPGLTWNKGLAMKNSGADKWTATFAAVETPITFKFLINDSEDQWSVGEDYGAAPGVSATFKPVF